MYKIILVPLDGSARAEAILPHVEELAGRYRARVIFLRVIDAGPLVSGPHESYAEIYLEQMRKREREAQSYLDSLQGEFRQKGIEAQGSLVHGAIVDAIVEAAREHNVDLIALASHGYTGLARVYYGSVAAGLLQRVDRPLLLVRSMD